MAGLAAAARARELGASPVVHEKGDRPGGSMLLSSGVVWRHRSAEEFHEDCPGGEPVLQRRIVDELDDALDWLEALGVKPAAAETGNPDRRPSLRLACADRDARPGGGRRAAADAVCGGAGARDRRLRCQARARTRPPVRASPWSEGDGLDYGLARGASVSEGLDEYYGRAMPGVVPEDEFASASQLYARHALVLDDAGADLGEAAWHESDVVQRFPGGKAWYVVDAAALSERTPYGTVGELIEVARAAGADVRPAEELPFELPASPKLAQPPFTAVRLRAAVTHTIGGLRVDEQARVLDRRGTPVEGLYAAGADAGGIFTGGYGSGLAAALVYGRIAAETALR